MLPVKPIGKPSVYVYLIFFITLIAYASAFAIGKDTMNTESKCKITAVKRSQEMIRTIIDDLTKSYTEVGGGGISQIKQSATDTYIVSISQEERIDQITYVMSMSHACKAIIDKRTETAISPY